MTISQIGTRFPRTPQLMDQIDIAEPDLRQGFTGTNAKFPNEPPHRWRDLNATKLIHCQQGKNLTTTLLK